MGGAVAIRTDFSAGELRGLARPAEDADQARRLLSLAAVFDGMSRKAAAEIGAMGRQTLRDWRSSSMPKSRKPPLVVTSSSFVILESRVGNSRQYHSD
jgi:hypothetical protein